MAMLRELKAALPDDDDDYEVVPPRPATPPEPSPARGSAFDKTKVVEASFDERLSGADAAAELSRKHLSTRSLEQSRERFEAANRAIDAWQQGVVETTSIRPEVAAAHAARSREEAKQDYIKDSVATISPEKARAKIEAVNRAAAAGQHDVVEASFNERLSAADAAVMDEAAREYARQDLAGEAVAPSVRTDGPPAKVLKLRPAGAAPEGTGAPKTETVTAADYAAKAVAAIAASGLGAAAATASARSATSQPTQAAKPQQGTIHLNPSVTRGEPKVAAPRSSPQAQAKAQAAAAENGQAYDREATAAERALMLGMKPFMSIFGKKPKAVGLSDEMIKQWQGGVAEAALKEASLSAADTHSTLTNLPKDALKGDVEAAANKAADTVGKFEAAAQSAGLMKDPLAKEQMLSNVRSAAEQFSKTLDGGKEKFGDAFNCEALMKQMKEMSDKIAEMMAKVAEAIQSVLPTPKR
jgi:hypothetical protein